MNPIAKSVLGSFWLRLSMFMIGVLVATQDGELWAVFAVLGLFLIGWAAEHASLEGWHQYKAEKERADG